MQDSDDGASSPLIHRPIAGCVRPRYAANWLFFMPRLFRTASKNAAMGSASFSMKTSLSSFSKFVPNILDKLEEMVYNHECTDTIIV